MGKKRSNKRPSSRKSYIPTLPNRWRSYILSIFIGIRGWFWRNKIKAETMWGLFLTAPPAFVLNYFSINLFQSEVDKLTPNIKDLTAKHALGLVVLASIWSIGLTTLRLLIAHWLRQAPPGWEKADRYLLTEFNNIVGLKETRFRGYLERVYFLRQAGTPPTPDDIFQSITHPEEQIKVLTSGIFRVFLLLLRQTHGDDANETLKVNLAIVRNGVLEGFPCHYPGNHPVRSNINELGNPRSCLMQAAKSGSLIVVESMLDESQKDRGCFYVTDEARANDDGSLICFPILLPSPGVVFVISICYGQPYAFHKKYCGIYRQLLDSFAVRLKLEYSLLDLKSN